jgi:hypothetical protein
VSVEVMTKVDATRAETPLPCHCLSTRHSLNEIRESLTLANRSGVKHSGSLIPAPTCGAAATSLL